MLVIGWVECATTGRAELVAISAVQISELGAGRLSCPACSSACGPSFRHEKQTSDMHLLTLRMNRWERSFVLGPSPR